jgi:hypothetical protein
MSATPKKQLMLKKLKAKNKIKNLKTVVSSSPNPCPNENDIPKLILNANTNICQNKNNIKKNEESIAKFKKEIIRKKNANDQYEYCKNKFPTTTTSTTTTSPSPSTTSSFSPFSIKNKKRFKNIIEAPKTYKECISNQINENRRNAELALQETPPNFDLANQLSAQNFILNNPNEIQKNYEYMTSGEGAEIQNSINGWIQANDKALKDIQENTDTLKALCLCVINKNFENEKDKIKEEEIGKTADVINSLIRQAYSNYGNNAQYIDSLTKPKDCY